MITENQIRAAIGEEARRLLRPMPNIMLADHDAGTQETSGHEGVNAPAFSTRRIEAAEGSAADANVFWKVSFDEDVASFTDCDYMRGGLTKTALPDSYQVTGADGDIWLAAWINTEDGSCVIHEGASRAAVTDESFPADSATFKLPLYKIVKSTDLNMKVSLRVKIPYIKGIPTLVLY